MKKTLGIILTLLFVILAAAPVTILAGTDQNVDVDIEMPDILGLSWDPTNIGSSVQLTGANRIGAYEYRTGYVDSVNGGILIVNSNAVWDLTVTADANTFSGGSGIKPASDIYVDTDLHNTYLYQINGLTPVVLYNSETPDTVHHDILYKIMFTPLDSPGTYSINLTYTLVKI
jgi:hypothetical protein